MLELGEDLLDGVQVGRVFGQEDELGAGRSDEPAYGFAFVAAQVVHDDDVAGTKCRDENLLDVGLKSLAVDRPVQKPRSVDPVVAQGSQEGGGLPMTVRDFGLEPQATWRPSAQRCHVGLGPGLVDEDQTLRVDLVLIFDPLCPSPGDVGAVAFASHHGFF